MGEVSGLKDLLDRLPIDTTALRKLPVPGLSGDCILELDLARGISETAPTSPVEALRERNTPTLLAIVTGLRDAAKDDRVLGLIVHAHAPGISPAHAEEVRAAVEGFSDSGKPTLAWAETYGEFTNGSYGYLVASATDEIWLQPTGYLQMTGAAAEGVFVREALDKMSVEPQFGRRHEYKSAVETFTERQISEPNREMLQSITDSVVETTLSAIARGRGLEMDDLRGLLTEGVLSPERGRDLPLIDHVGYRDEAYTAMRERVGDSDHDADLRYVERYDSGFDARETMRNRKRPVVAIVQASGSIHLGRSGGSPLGGRSIGSESLTAALRAVGEDDKVEAVVLRVDSPGGSATASDAIRREILRLKEQKPVVASMGTVAGSGGYYIAMPCTEIVASGSTLTGSIGVLAGKNVIQPGLDRLGIHRALIETGPHAGMLSSVRRFTDAEWELLNQMLDDIYADFTSKAAQDRGMSLDQLEPLARGRVWTGAQAVERDLVDHLGGLQTAIERACDLADLDPDGVVTRISPKLGPLDRFMPADNSDSVAAAFRLGEGLPLLDQALSALGLANTGVLAMNPIRWR